MAAAVRTVARLLPSTYSICKDDLVKHAVAEMS
jgi:hypothetical protein